MFKNKYYIGQTVYIIVDGETICDVEVESISERMGEIDYRIEYSSYVMENYIVDRFNFSEDELFKTKQAAEDYLQMNRDMYTAMHIESMRENLEKYKRDIRYIEQELKRYGEL